VVPEIITKLDKLLKSGIEDEQQAVYLMVGLRKLLEHQKTKQTYSYLNFHCNWAVHTKLSGDAAQDILKHFSAASTHLKAGLHLHQLPHDLRHEIDRISQMGYFEDELDAFLKANNLPSIAATRYDGWTHFLHSYVNVISDCPLVIASNNNTAGIQSVTVNVELANQSIEDEMMYRITWKISDSNGKVGSIEIYNSFSLNPERPADYLSVQP
jgi:hypothetical protein